MGLQRGAVFVSGGVRSDQVLLFHEAVPAQELELGVGAARSHSSMRRVLHRSLSWG